MREYLIGRSMRLFFFSRLYDLGGYMAYGIRNSSLAALCPTHFLLFRCYCGHLPGDDHFASCLG